MSRRWVLLYLLAGALAVAGFLIWTRSPEISQPPQLSLMPATTEGEFARADSVPEINLPEDHGPHSDYQTEWWYYTGNLANAAGRRFAYQLTFFRRGLIPDPPERQASLATGQIYFAHLALIDVSTGQHFEWERFSRGAADLAGAQAEPLRIWLEDWSARGLNQEGSRIRLQAEADSNSLNLELAALKPIVAHGDQGLSPKSAEPGNASYYLSYTRMATQGEITLEGITFQVEGSSWFDHEWSTSALGSRAVGWDWFSLQLSDGRELMYFQIRRQDGSVEPVSSGTLVNQDGSLQKFDFQQVELMVLDEWQSPTSGALYPSGWRLSLPDLGLDLTIEPLIADQEMNLSFTYWEGAVRIEGESAGEPVTGFGFVEMTGYAESMQGTF